MANGNQLQPLPAFTPVPRLDIPTPGTIDANAVLNALRQPRPTFTELAFPQVLPLLAPSEGLAPEVEKAIANIQQLGQEGIRRSVSGATTQAQRRGLTGSSIEAGAIGEATRAGERDILSQITPILLESARTKEASRKQLADFLTQALGIDFSQQGELVDKFAQALGQELGRRTQLDIAQQTIESQERQALLGAIGGILGGGGKLAAALF
jgi:hypothetical protein